MLLERSRTAGMYKSRSCVAMIRPLVFLNVFWFFLLPFTTVQQTLRGVYALSALLTFLNLNDTSILGGRTNSLQSFVLPLLVSGPFHVRSYLGPACLGFCYPCFGIGILLSHQLPRPSLSSCLSHAATTNHEHCTA